MRVLLLFGGFTEEREVSINSASGVRKALGELGHQIIDFDLKENNLCTFTQTLSTGEIDVIFNALHGPFGEDGQIQGVCNYYKIPYTHSGQLSSALAMNKHVASKLFKAAGVPTIEEKIVTKANLEANSKPFSYPFILKPVDSGSSYGIHIIKNQSDLTEIISHWSSHTKHLCQPFIKGQEVHVAILNNKALGTIEIMPSREFYDYTAKYTKGLTEFKTPANITSKQEIEVFKLAEKAHKTLECRGVTRVDFIRDNNGFHILEVNTQPGLTETSLIPQIAKIKGLNYTQVIEMMLKEATYDDALNHIKEEAS